jgi:general secretion pathway protein G
MARRRLGERTVFLPWERQGALRRLGLRRARPLAFAALFVVALAGLWARERRRSGVRSTRAAILVARRGLDTYRADHEGQCPPGGLDELAQRGYLAQAPGDAWGRPLRLSCPGRRPGKAYDLLSDGPDGEPGGLDRVE